MNHIYKKSYMILSDLLTSGFDIYELDSKSLRQIRLINVVTIILLVAVVCFLIICQSMNTIGIKPVLILSIAVSILNALGLRYFKKIEFSSHITLINLTTTIFLCNLVIGGAQASIMIWIPLIPVASIVLVERWVSFYFLLAVLMVIYFFGFYEHHYVLENPIDDIKLKLLQISSFFFALLTITLTINSLILEQRNYEVFLEKQNTELSEKKDEYQFLAFHDELTSLSNRYSMERQLKRMLSSLTADDKIYIFYIDLDNLKAINDELGHDVGDHALNIVGQRLKYVFKHTDIIARIGGDEFLVALKSTDIEFRTSTIVDLSLIHI